LNSQQIMEVISNQIKHPTASYVFSISRIFERIHYYGIRSILIIYLLSDAVNMPNTDAYKLYGWIITGYAFSRIIGGLLGDLVLSNKLTTIIGGVLSSIGAFVMTSTEITNIYIGIVLLVLGGGLYSPNLLSQYGKGYHNRTKLLDAGFSILYLMVNLGGLLGGLIIAKVSLTYGYFYGFMLAGFIMLFSVIFLFFIKSIDNHKLETHLSFDKRIFYTVGTVIVVNIFWFTYAIITQGHYEMFDQIKSFLGPEILAVIGEDLYTLILFPTLNFTFLAIIIWSFFYYNQLTKLIIGFVSATVAIALLLFIPENMNDIGFNLFVLSAILLGFAEIHIGPIILSVITKYINPKYLAIVIATALFIPSIMISIIYKIMDLFENFPYFEVSLSIFAMTSFILIGALLIMNKQNE